MKRNKFSLVRIITNTKHINKYYIDFISDEFYANKNNINPKSMQLLISEYRDLINTNKITYFAFFEYIVNRMLSCYKILG